MSVAAVVCGNKIIRGCCEMRRDLRASLWHLYVKNSLSL
jgi:hypothetical protein